MFVDFNTLPSTARVWIYQAHRTLARHEVEQIDEKLKHFISNWKRHGDDLKASFQIKYNQFIILAVDEAYTATSGCSIDASVHLLRTLEKEFDIDLFNKMNVSFKNGENINTISLKEFKEYAKQKKITNHTVVFNNMVKTKAGLESEWQVEANQSWHAKYLI